MTIGSARPGETIRVEAAAAPAEHIERVLAEGPAEAFAWDGELTLVLYDADEPIGLLAGRHEAWPDGDRFLHLTNFMLRPAWRGRGLWQAFGPDLLAHCRAHRLKAMTCAFKADDPPAVVRVVARWGFRPYRVEGKTGLTWWVRFVDEEN